MIVITLLLLGICFITYMKYYKKKFLELEKSLYFKEWYKSYPLVGIAYICFGSNANRMKTITQMSQKLNKHGKRMASAWMGPEFYIFTCDAEVVDLILKKQLEKAEVYKMFHPIAGDGSIAAPVSIWRPRRKILAPAFSPKSLSNFVHTFIRNSEILAEKLHHESGRGPFKLWPYLAAASMDNVLETILGIQLNVQDNRDHPFVKDQSEALELINNFLPLVILLHKTSMIRLFPIYKKMKYYSKRVYNFVSQVIDLKRKELQHNNSEDKIQTFLGEVMETSKCTELELTEEVLVLMVAGTDTTALATGFTVVLLARYPHVQKKVYKELLQVFGDSDRRVEPEDLDRLTYLEAVIKESLRLYPPGPLTGAEYGMLSLKIALATLLRQYRVLPSSKDDHFRLSMEVMLKDTNGFVVALETRKKTEMTNE